MDGQREVVRDVVDLGLRVTAQLPEAWSEVELDGTILTVGGPLGDGPGTLVPTVQISVRTAESAEAAAAAITSVPGQLEEAVVGFSGVRELDSGTQETVLEVAHHSPVLGATQISQFRGLFLSDRGLTLVVVGTCGGAASEDAKDALREVVRSVTITSRAAVVAPGT